MVGAMLFGDLRQEKTVLAEDSALRRLISDF